MSITMPGPWKHPTTAMLYLKQRVPADLRNVAKGMILHIPVDGTLWAVRVGDQVKVSLRTKDVATAKLRHREADDAVQGHWMRLRRDVVDLSHKQILALAGEAARAIVRAFEDEPGSPQIWKEILRLQVSAGAAADYEASLERWLGSTVDGLLSAERLMISPASRSALLQRSHVSLAEAAIDLLRKAEGDYSATETLARYPEWTAPTVAAKANGERQTISGLFDLWKFDRARNGGSESSARRWQGPIRSFIAFLGHDDAQAVTPQDIIRWRNAIGEAGEVAPSTFNKVHLAAVKAIFSHGVNNLILASNPVLGIKSRAPKAQQTRPLGFTQEEAEKILTAANGALTAPGGTGLVLRQALRWVPWLCAYSGARVGEMAQLRKEDVLTIDGIACLRITPEAGTVKTGSFRDVPIHSHLIDMGFLDFVEGHPNGPLFYAAGRSASARPWTTTMGRLSDWVRKTAGVTDTRVAPSHGWRHRFTAIADEVDIDPKFSRAIGGWSAGSQGDKYGHRSAKTLKREIEKLPRYAV